ncbi:putative Ankyrin repeat-containing protein [Melia azedarach]|uniref:Ankyrin repeat-containing protein n=1 Tax=Melia azedarach TaxID=155640 RepID=A0ACC1Y0K6_MELAZ|nr:putative Ankyrin repeat-containing protein [Melia azedarach]
MTSNTIHEDELTPVDLKRDTDITAEMMERWEAYWSLCKMIQENDWKGVEDFVGDHPEALTVEISHSGQAIFEYIVIFIRDDMEGAACLIDKLASKVDPRILEQKSHPGMTVLSLCAILGNTSVSKVLVKYCRNLPNVRSNDNWLPVHNAAVYGHKDTVKYLVQVTAEENLLGSDGAALISCLVRSKLYDVALDFLKRYPKMGRDHISSRNVVLGTLALKPLAFESGNQLGPLQRFLYNCIPVEKEKISGIDQTSKNRSAGVDVENAIVRSKKYSTKSTSFRSLPKIDTIFGGLCKDLHMMFWNAIILLFPCIKVIQEQKLAHQQTTEIVRMICDGVVWNDPHFLELSLLSAASFGISEFVNELIMANNGFIYMVNNEGHNIFLLAVLHRQENIFNLIYGFLHHSHALNRADNLGNNILHLAGRLVPSSKVPGAALQMQRELHWFKAIENLLPAWLHEEKNFDGKTPREVFTESHEKLVKEGEKWMKDTAQSCTIAVTLIITVVFAAAFTVPGGNNNGGQPIFLKEKSFLIFTIADALALFSSTTSLLMFLGILTSRYSEEDFLVSLPRKLIIGLITLFFSIATMMVAFGATIYIILSQPWKWVIIPIALLGCLPVTLFTLLQFPLLLDMVLSTYGPSIFHPVK